MNEKNNNIRHGHKKKILLSVANQHSENEPSY